MRPWYITAAGHLVVLLGDPDEAHRAHSGLLERGQDGVADLEPGRG